MRGLFSELRRRNVIKVAVAYAVVAWLIVQIVVSVEAPLSLPDWVDSVTIIFLAVGFPVALVMAWALELTPEGVKLSSNDENARGSESTPRRSFVLLIVATFVLAVAALLADRFFLRASDTTTDRSLAVLPFTDLSRSGDQEYFADGIAEELLNRLSSLKGLRVAGRTSSFSFRDGGEDLREIGSKLGVANILEGSVRKLDDRVRIAVQLVQASDGFQVWSESYDRELTDIFAIQEEIARSVANSLSIALDVGEREFGSIGTRNIEAYDTALKGRAAMLRPDPESSAQAIALLREAIALDPDYAYAWSLLSTAYVEAGTVWNSQRATEYFEQAHEAASRALQGSPDSPDSLRAMGVVQVRRSQWREAEANLQRALELSPADEISNLNYGWFLLNVGRAREALRYYQRSSDIDPLAISPAMQIFMAQRAIGNVDDSRAVYDRLRAMGVESPLILGGGLTFAMELNDRAMIEQHLETTLDLSGLPAGPRALTLTMLNFLDQPADARQALLGYAENPDYSASLDKTIITVFASYFGADDLALSIFQELRANEVLPNEILWRPIHANMRRLPGFKTLLQEEGLISYWQQSGIWGDFCQPVGDDDLECM